MDDHSRHEAMFLSQLLDDPGVNLALELFLRMAHHELGDSLLAVLLYGSILYDDLASGYGDLDFLVVVQDDLDKPARTRLNRLRAPLRSGYYGVYCQMLEGAFLPVAMLGPDSRGGGLWWGVISRAIIYHAFAASGTARSRAIGDRAFAGDRGPLVRGHRVPPVRGR